MKLPKSYMSAKHEVHYPFNTRIIKVVLSCHGNKVSKTASTTRYCYDPGTYIPNIRIVCYQQKTYEGISLLPWIQGFHSNMLHHFDHAICFFLAVHCYLTLSMGKQQ